MNTGVWSEMLVDRKFFYPVDAAAPTPPPVIGNAVGNPRLRLPPTRWWAPIGGAGVVIMDSKLPYSGDQSPLVKLDPKIRTASVKRESQFGMARVTSSALCLPVIRRPS